MTTSRDPDRLLRAYLAEGMTVLPDRVERAVLNEVQRTRQRAVSGSWRNAFVTSMMKIAVGVVAVVAIALVGLRLGPGAGPGGPGSPSPSPSSSPTPSLSASPSSGASRMTIAGTTITFGVELPAGWQNSSYAANPGQSGQPRDVAFFAAFVDNTYLDPCAHVEREPKVERTVEAVVAALRELPGMTSTEPIATTIAGLDATYLELTAPGTLPCSPDAFYLWKDSPTAYWWLAEPAELLRIWVVERNGVPIAFTARSWPRTSEAAKAELVAILETIELDAP